MPERLGQSQVFMGVDVSEQRLDAHRLPGSESLSLTHDARGIGRLVAWLASKAGPFVVLEATGGLEQRLARALGQAGIVVAVVSPSRAASAAIRPCNGRRQQAPEGRIRDFARAAGLLAKHALGRPAADPGDRPARCPVLGTLLIGVE